MRDDASLLFAEAAGLFRKKTSLLSKIEEHTARQFSLLRAENTGGLEDSTLELDSMMDEIDSLDFDISLRRDEILRLTGMSPEGFRRFCGGSGEPAVREYAQAVGECVLKLERVSEIRDELLEEMKKKSDFYRESADEMERIVRLRRHVKQQLS